MVIIILIGFIPKRTMVQISAGEDATIVGASFWRSLFPEASARIVCGTGNKHTVAFALWQDAFDGPITIFGSKDTNVLFCLYDYDVTLELFRIDKSRPFIPPPNHSDISRILFTSSCEIKEATYDDWHEVLRCLRDTEVRKLPFRSASVTARSYNNPEAILMALQ